MMHNRTAPICPICRGEGHIYVPKGKLNKYKNEYPVCHWCNGAGKISDFKYENLLGKVINGKIECPYCGQWHDIECKGDKNGLKCNIKGE